MEEEEIDPLIGQAVGGYLLEGVIGEGGMGVVYLGVHPTLGKRVAVKVILRAADSNDARDRFLEEAKLAASLEHPAIVDVLDLSTLPDGRLYMVMEFLDGEPLSRLFARRGALPPAEAATIAAEALSGLTAAHARGMVHRDIKPANLFLVRAGDRGQLKILDFGLAKLFAQPKPRRTHSGAIVGTPGYMAPEQAGGTQVEAPADVYAMGVVLYEMLSGAPPFASDDWVELLHLHRTTPPPPLVDVPDALRAVVERALAKAPAQRFSDAGAMREALVTAVGGEAALARLPLPQVTSMVVTSSTPRHARSSRAESRETRALRPPGVPKPAPRRRRSWIAAGAAVGLGGIAWLAWPRSSEPIERKDAQLVAVMPIDGAVAIPRDAAAIIETPRDVQVHVDAGAIAARPRDAVARIGDHGDATVTTAVAAGSTTYFTLPASDVPDISAFDFTVHLSDMQALARRVFPDARLIHVGGSGMRPDGTFDLTNPNHSVGYTFRSAAQSTHGGLRGETYQCLVYVTPSSGGIQVMATSSTCEEPFFEPRCTGKMIWDKARAEGAPEMIAGLFLYHYDDERAHMWRLAAGKYYNVRDADCAH